MVTKKKGKKKKKKKKKTKDVIVLVYTAKLSWFCSRVFPSFFFYLFFSLLFPSSSVLLPLPSNCVACSKTSVRDVQITDWRGFFFSLFFLFVLSSGAGIVQWVSPRYDFLFIFVSVLRTVSGLYAVFFCFFFWPQRGSSSRPGCLWERIGVIKISTQNIYYTLYTQPKTLFFFFFYTLAKPLELFSNYSESLENTQPRQQK